MVASEGEAMFHSKAYFKAVRAAFAFIYIAAIFAISLALFLGLSALVPWVLDRLTGGNPSPFVSGMIDFFAVCLGVTVIAVLADHLKTTVVQILEFIKGTEPDVWVAQSSDEQSVAQPVTPGQSAWKFFWPRIYKLSFMATCCGIAFAALTAKSGEKVINDVERSAFYRELRENHFREERTVIYQVVDFESSDDFLWRVRFPNARKSSGLTCDQALIMDPARDAFDSTVLGASEEFEGQASLDRERMLQGIATSLRKCPSGSVDLTVQGFASNAPFAGCSDSQSRALNRQLAEVRRDVVADWIVEHRDITVEPRRRTPQYPSTLSVGEMRQSPNSDQHRSAVVRITIDCPD